MAYLKSYLMKLDDKTVMPLIKASQVYLPTSNMNLEEKYGAESFTFLELIDCLFPKGYIYKTTQEIDLNNFDFDNLTVSWHWERLPGGYVCVGEGTYTDSNGETGIFYDEQDISNENTIIGEYFHKLTVDELPSHTHLLPRATSDDGKNHTDIGRDGDASGHYTAYRGGDTPHNNILPSKVVYMYLRVR